MKRHFLLTILFFRMMTLLSVDYSKVDEQSHYVPFQLKTPVAIAKYLTRNLQTEEEKVRAIFFWTANNIRYDVNQIPGTDYRFQVSKQRNFLKEVLESHKGVCQHYALLFDTLCHSIGIKSYLIAGYTRQNEYIAELSHAWNGVVVNGKYYMLDVTWCAGYIEDNKFRQEFNDELFLVAPSKFIYTHIPFDPIWQFLNNPVTHSAIIKNDFSCLKKHGNFNFNDSIKAIENRDPKTNLICENKRINSSGITNSMIRTYINYNEQNILYLRSNSAVENFNKAVEKYNLYVVSKNKQFDRTTMSDDSIQNLVKNAQNLLEKSEKELKSIDVENSSTSKNDKSLQSSITKLKAELSSEEAFVKTYISTLKPMRMLLFRR